MRMRTRNSLIDVKNIHDVHPDLVYFGTDITSPLIQDYIDETGVFFEDGRDEEGRNEDGRNEEGRNEEGRNEEGRNEEGRNEEGRNEGKNLQKRNAGGFVPLYLKSHDGNHRNGTHSSRLSSPLLLSYYQACRSGHLYNHAAIPSLLKTCRESRECMQRSGYHLTFSTRSSLPRTWFSYPRDILFMRSLDSDINHGIMSELIDGTGTNIGQFRPAEFTQVRRVALDFSKWIAWDAHWLYEILRIVQLFSHLSELILVLNCDWWFQDIRGGFVTCLPRIPAPSSSTFSSSSSSSTQTPFPVKEHWRTGGGIDWSPGGGTTLKTPANSKFPWGFVEIEDEESFWRNYVTPSPGTFALTNDGNYRFKIREWERRWEGTGEKKDFFREWKRGIEESLREKQEEDEADSGGCRWAMPTIRLVFLRQEEGLHNI
ncbi:hypothetical protein NHQ30_004262 [Ciborinia camelliae]|nr:hypothetical protein NHQ30_004262 [Ciborinia camelliae]